MKTFRAFVLAGTCDTEDRNLLYVRVLEVVGFQLVRINVLAIGQDNHFLLSSGDEEISPIVHSSQVPGEEPSITPHLRRRLRIPIIAVHDNLSAYRHVSYAAFIRIHNLDLNSRKRLPYRAQHIVFGAGRRCRTARLRQAVSL